MSVNATEAARITGVDKSTMVRWLQAGKVAGAEFVNGVWSVPVESLDGLKRSPQGRKKQA